MDTYEGSPFEPASLHKYLYCHGDPVNYADPTGHFDFTVSSMAMVGAIAGTLVGFSYGAYKGYLKNGDLFSLQTLQNAALYGLVGFAAGAIIGAAIGYLIAGSGLASTTGLGPVGTYTRVVTKILDHLIQNIWLGKNLSLAGVGLTLGAFLGGAIAGAAAYVVAGIRQSAPWDEYAIDALAATTLTVPFWTLARALGSRGGTFGPAVVLTSFVAGFNTGYFAAAGADWALEQFVD